MKNKIFILFVILIGLFVILTNSVNALYSDNGSLAQNVNDCGTLNTTNAVYTLINNVTSNSTCFSINATNITLDGNRYAINYSADGTVGYGVYVNGYNFSQVKNSYIYEGRSGTSSKHAIYLIIGNNASILNNTIIIIGAYSIPIYLVTNSNNSLIAYNIIKGYDSSGGSRGIFLSSSSNANITQNNITTIDYSKTIYLSASSNNIIFNNNISASGLSSWGLYMDSNSNNNQIDDNLIRATSGLYMTSSSNNLANRNNITGSPGVQIDTSTNNSFYNNNATASSSKSFLISGTSSPHFNHTLGNDNRADGLPLNYTFSQNNLNFNAINFSQYGQTIFAALNNLTITNSNFTANGLSLYLVTNSTISNNNITTSKNVDAAIHVYRSSDNSIKNNLLRTPGSQLKTLYLDTSSNNNIIDNNTINTGGGDQTRSIDVLTSINNNISNNRITNTNQYNAHGIVIETTSTGNKLINNSIAITGTGGGSTYGIWIYQS